ncbi:MAG: PEP/pyruvate-binding domain-containing protein [Planctomycetota bacterium]
MRWTLAFSLALAASAALADAPQEGAYAISMRPYGPGAARPGTLALRAAADGSFEVEHSTTSQGQTTTLRGRGRYDASGDRLSFEFSSGLSDSLDLFGQGYTARGTFRFTGSRVRGWITLRRGSQRWSFYETGELDAQAFALVVPDRATFERLSRRDNVPGAMGVREVKFLVTGVDGATPRLHFIDTQRFSFHYDFATRGLGLNLSLQDFNARTYFTDQRSFLAGSIIAHDAFERPDGGQGVYTVEFWPTDPVKVDKVEVAFDQVVAGMPFASEHVYYHPAGETHERLYAEERAEFDQRQIRVLGTRELFGNVTFSALNPGVGYGRLRLMDGSGPPPTVRDVVVFQTIPNDLSHVAGVITAQPQTPLSHINLKAKQNDTPNAYVKDAATDARLQPLFGRWVKLEVDADGFEVTEISEAEAMQRLDALRPDPQTPARDLSLTDVRDLDDLGLGDVARVGAKAAGVAELRKILPASMIPDGFAIPFSFYDRFMRANGLYDEARQMLADPAFQEVGGDAAERDRQLRAFRRRIRDAPVPADLRDAIGALQQQFPSTQPLRCRSSTNNEDLQGFNGAGLYDSYTHRPDEGHLENTVRQVWSSLWNFRAFEERSWYRIDHFQAAMGVLVHPNFDEERANGVAVTKNIYDPNWAGFYVNVQVDESLVTNPDAGATPDEFLIARLGPNNEYEVQYIQRSNQLPQGQQTVLSPEQVSELTRALDRIQRHFKQAYGAQNDSGFAMDVEFKISRAGRLAIKQARPWVD